MNYERSRFMLKAFLRTAFPVLVLSSLALSQGTTADDTNASCIEKLQIPNYVPLARYGRLSGTFTVSVVLGPDATVQSISSEMVATFPQSKGIFIPAIEKALRSSVFARRCGGKTVKLVFQFVLGDGEPSDHGQEVSFAYPNRFWISVPPTPLNP
jgi:hypothetical protein